MSKKVSFIILILSVVVTYLTQVFQVFLGGSCSVFGGECGFPIAFSSAGFLSKAKVDYMLFLVDIFFWFIIIFGFWKIYQKYFMKQ